MKPSMPGVDQTPEDIRWVKFWETSGSLSAEVIAGRLRSEGIPAWIWQQGAGAALGLTYGPMGRGHVMVPEENLEEARRLMAEDLTQEAEGEYEWPDSEIEELDHDEDDGWLSKAVLGLTALAISPLGVAAAFLVANLFGGEEDIGPVCSYCGTMVDLEEEEKEQGWFICPDCGRTVLTR